MTAGVPLLLAGLGEQISEKAGVLNIGIEGMMLFGAYTGFVAAYYSGSFWLGFIAGGLGGMVVASDRRAALHPPGPQPDRHRHRAHHRRRGSHRLAAFLPVQQDLSAPRQGAGPRNPGLLAGIPVLGPALFSHNIVVYLAVGLVVVLTWLFRAQLYRPQS